MGLIVQKFGGSSVKDRECLFRVAKTVTDTYKAGNEVIVVVSAQGDTTDDLIEKAKEINERASKREMDMLLSTGEQISIALLAMAIEKLGFPVVSLTGWQAGFITHSNHGAARIRRIEAERIRRELDSNNIVVVAGFQGLNRFGDITTLGRGGSDTSAVALAAALHADRCQIYTDVDGVYTADPRIVKNAVKLDEITYDEMLELASLGAGVLHNRSVEMAKKYHVNLEVLSSIENKPGTIVKEAVKVEKLLIKGVAKDEDVARIALIGLPDTPGIAFKIFSLLAAKKINVDTVPLADKDIALEVLQEKFEILGAERIEAEDDVVKVSIVGAGMQSNPGVAAKMFEALYDANINIQMISTSEIKISVLIARKDADRAVVAVHDAFDFNQK